MHTHHPSQTIRHRCKTEKRRSAERNRIECTSTNNDNNGKHKTKALNVNRHINFVWAASVCGGVKEAETTQKTQRQRCWHRVVVGFCIVFPSIRVCEPKLSVCVCTVDIIDIVITLCQPEYERSFPSRAMVSLQLMAEVLNLRNHSTRPTTNRLAFG